MRYISRGLLRNKVEEDTCQAFSCHHHVRARFGAFSKRNKSIDTRRRQLNHHVLKHWLTTWKWTSNNYLDCVGRNEKEAGYCNTLEQIRPKRALQLSQWWKRAEVSEGVWACFGAELRSGEAVKDLIVISPWFSPYNSKQGGDRPCGGVKSVGISEASRIAAKNRQ